MSKENLIRNANEELISKGDENAIGTYFSEEYIAHADNKSYQGHVFIKSYLGQLRSAIPDVSVKEVKIFTVTDEIATWQRTIQGTHKTNMRGIPASNKVITWNEMVTSRFDGDLIAEEWVVSELAGQLFIKQPKTK